MVLWLVVVGIVALILWAIWHEKQQRRKEEAGFQAREAVSEQRRQLEDQLLQERAQERTIAAEQALAQLEAQENVSQALQSLAGLLPQSTPDEQWRILHTLNRLLQSRYSGRSLTAPLPPEVLEWLRTLSARPEGSRRQGNQHDRLHLEALDWQGLVLEGLNLRGAELQNCRLVAARLPRLDLFAASCDTLELKSARLEGANLTGASLKAVHFDRADLRKAELISAELRECSLQGADLTGATLRGARLSDCDLRGANLSQASGLSYEQLLSCRLDAQTRLPANLQSRQAELLARSQKP